MLTYTTVTTPQYANDSASLISLMVTFDHIGTPVEFLASLSDTESHGRELYTQAVAGDFGTIAPFIAPVVTPVDLALEARNQRDTLLATSDWTVLTDSPLTAAKKTLWKTYRQDLRDITTQVDFPTTIVWPTKPV
jgi:hypothetical protein